MKKADLGREHITSVVCNGAHAPMLRRDLELKLGSSILSDYLVLNQSPYENLSETSVVLGNTCLRINRYYLSADLKIAIGSIIPHCFARFSAGAKLVLPGLSDISTLERTHKSVMMGFRGGVDNVEENKFRLELEKAVSQIGLNFFVGVVPNSNREVAGVQVGDPVEAHRAGVHFARKIFQTEVMAACEVLVLNAYPKDTDLFPADTAFTPLRTTDGEVVKKDGAAVITTPCSNGLGYPSLFGPGMPLYRRPKQRRFLKGKDLIVYSPNVRQAELHTVFLERLSTCEYLEFFALLVKRSV